MSTINKKDVYLVIGGSGFVGRHIVQQLLARGDTVSVFDIVQRYHDTPFYYGDISEQEDVAKALKQSGTTCIIHTASPPHGLDPALYWKVNVDGTNAVIAAAVEVGVRKLVFTSSAGVVFNGTDLIDVDERLPYPEKPLDAYNESKAKAEQAVLEANGKGGLLTVALRPAGIFGPGDRQAIPGFWDVYESGRTHWQIGDNTNLFDWTYVENVAHAHLIAADKLENPPPAPPFAETGAVLDLEAPPALTGAEEAMLNEPLPPLDKTVGHHKVPTSLARPLGPYSEKPEDGDNILAQWKSDEPLNHPRPIVRTKYNPMSDFSIQQHKMFNPEKSPLQVAGQTFFITNGEPLYFWDFPRTLWGHWDKMFPGKRQPRAPTVMSKSIGMTLAALAETAGWVVGKEPKFNTFRVTFTCTQRWHNIEKARRILGYEPLVGLDEGIRRTMEHWKAEHDAASTQ